MSDHKFYITVIPDIEYIYIFYLENKMLKYINEMEYVSSGIKTEKIFNGTIPPEHMNKKLYLKLIGIEGKTNYTFNNLFNIPINLEILNKLKLNNLSSLNNFIIINTPEDIKYVIIDVPKRLQELLHLPSSLVIYKVDKEKMDKISVTEQLSKGIDPQGIQYIRNIQIDLRNILKYEIFEEVIKILENTEFIVKCFKYESVKEFTIS